MRHFELLTYFEPLSDDPSYFEKAMFGGLAIYFRGLLVALIMESRDDGKEAFRYRGKSYPFKIWDGVLLPTDRPFHQSLLTDFKLLLPHPVLGKWLYWTHSDEPEQLDVLDHIIRKIRGNDPRFGIVPKPRKAKKLRRKV